LSGVTFRVAALADHARQGAEAEASIKEIEDDVSATTGRAAPVDESKELEIRPAEQIGYSTCSG